MKIKRIKVMGKYNIVLQNNKIETCQTDGGSALETPLEFQILFEPNSLEDTSLPLLSPGRHSFIF